MTLMSSMWMMNELFLASDISCILSWLGVPIVLLLCLMSPRQEKSFLSTYDFYSC